MNKQRIRWVVTKKTGKISEILKLPVIPLIIILIWMGLMFDKISENPVFSLALILGILVVLFGGTLIVGKLLKVEGRMG